jgi:hypothetical protein
MLSPAPNQPFAGERHVVAILCTRLDLLAVDDHPGKDAALPMGTIADRCSTQSLRRSAAACVVVLAILSSPARSHAAEPVEVEALIRQGVEMRQKGRDQAALPLLQKAYDLGRSPRTAAQLGLAELALGYVVPAERHLDEALSSSTHFWIAKHRPTLEAALKDARKGVAHLEVNGSPAGAQVFVNGSRVGVLPLAHPVPVAEGVVDLRVEALGFVEQSTQLKIAGEGHGVWSVNLVANTRSQTGSADKPSQLSPAPVAPSAGGLAGSHPAQPSGQRRDVAIITDLSSSETHGDGTQSKQSSDQFWRRAGYVAVGGAGLSLIAGIALHKRREDRAAEFNQRCFPLAGADCASLESGVSSAGTGAAAAYVGSALLAGGAAYLLWRFTSPTLDNQGTRASLGCTGTWPWGVTCGTQF